MGGSKKLNFPGVNFNFSLILLSSLSASIFLGCLLSERAEAKVFKGTPVHLTSSSINYPTPVFQFQDNMQNAKLPSSRQQFDSFPTGTGSSPVKRVKTTSEAVNNTMRVLVVFATFIAFILQPIVELIVGAATSSQIFRSLAKSFNEHERRMAILSESENSALFSARGILDKDQCIELITCYATGYGRSDGRRTFSSSLSSLISYYFLPGKTLNKRQDDGNGKQGNDTSCSQYRCDPVSFIVRLFIYLVDWNTLLKA